MSEYKDSNVGLGMVPHTKSCRCLECENERWRKKLAEANVRLEQATTDHLRLIKKYHEVREQRDAANARTEEALHASAPDGCKCADCTMDREPCPKCYAAWWQSKHPHTFMVSVDDSTINALREQVKVLLERERINLHHYGRHANHCMKLDYLDERSMASTCGFDETLAATEPKEKP